MMVAERSVGGTRQGKGEVRRQVTWKVCERGKRDGGAAR